MANFIKETDNNEEFDYNLFVKETTERVENIVEEISEKHPRVFPLVDQLNVKSTLNVPTAAVSNKGELFYNPFFIGTLNDEQLQFILYHEAFHCVLNHINRFCEYENISTDVLIGKDETYKDEELKEIQQKFSIFNVAADSVINENIILSELIYDYPSDLIRMKNIAEELDEDEKELINLSAEEIYQKLLNKKEENKAQQADGESLGCDGDSGSESNTGFDVDNIIEKVKKYIEEVDKVKELLDEQPETETSSDEEQGSHKDGGTQEQISFGTDDSGSIKRDKDIIQDLIETDSQQDWKKILTSVAESKARSVREKTFKRPSRKYRDIYPISKGRSHTKSKNSVFLSIDVSGSIMEEQLKKEIKIISEITETTGIDLKYCFFANRCSEVFEFESLEDFSVELERNNVGGGTYFEKAIKHFSEESDDVFAILGDMMFDNIEEANEFLNNNENVVYIDIKGNIKEYFDIKDESRYIVIDNI